MYNPNHDKHIYPVDQNDCLENLNIASFHQPIDFFSQRIVQIINHGVNFFFIYNTNVHYKPDHKLTTAGQANIQTVKKNAFLYQIDPGKIDL